MGSKAFDDLLYVKIPIPTSSDVSIGYGVHSTHDPNAGKIDTRFNADDYKMVKEAAKLLDLNPSTFLRLCAVNTAKQITEHVNAYQQSNGGG